VDSDGSLVGTTENGGTADAGVIFRLSAVATPADDGNDDGGGGGALSPAWQLFALSLLLLRCRARSVSD
jgi:uncharacterized repeat protein (TIGR03803 family)